MSVKNEIKLKEVMESMRMDAEFYQPVHIEIYNNLLEIDHLTFGDIMDVCKKGIFDIKADNYVNHGVPFIRISNLKKGVVDDTNLTFIPKEIHESEIKTEFHENDIVLSKTAIPAASLIPYEICNISQDVIGISLNESSTAKLNEKYIVLFLNCKYGLLQMKRWFQGNIQMHLALDDVKKIIIPILSTEFQDKIAKLYLNAQKKVELSKKCYKKAEHILLDELNLLEYEDQNTINYSSDLQNVINFNRIDAQYFNPDHATFLDIIKSYENGYDYLLNLINNVKANFNPKHFPDDTFQYIELSNINLSTGIIDGYSLIKGIDAPGRAKRILEEKDLIVSSVEGSLEKVAMVSTEHQGSLASTGFFQFRSEKILPEVLLVLLKSKVVQRQMKRECTGTILTSVPSDSLKRIVIPLIKPEKQETIKEFVLKSHCLRIESYELLDQAKNEIEECILKMIKKDIST